MLRETLGLSERVTPLVLALPFNELLTAQGCHLATPLTRASSSHMPLIWKRVDHWKNIRALVHQHNSRVYAYIQRGRRPQEFTVVFPAYDEGIHTWSLRFMRKVSVGYSVAPFTITESTLVAAKAVGMLIVKSQGLDQHER